MFVESFRRNHDIINVGPSKVTVWTEHSIDFSLDVGYGALIAHNRNSEGLLTSMRNDCQTVPIFRLYTPLIEERSAVNNRNILATRHSSNDVTLEWQGVSIGLSNFIKFPNVHDSATLALTIR